MSERNPNVLTIARWLTNLMLQAHDFGLPQTESKLRDALDTMVREAGSVLAEQMTRELDAE